jgi:tRNA nucleotidyltransferase/poly(A) polymerase
MIRVIRVIRGFPTPIANRLAVVVLVPDQQRQFALEVLEKLRAAGFEAFWAGGCVRDLVLGTTPKDYDVATNARPEEVRKLFGRRRTIAVGAAFGVMVVVGPPGAGQVEVTTFRHDGKYSDGRHPDSVTFGTAEEDVKRRDFTINGMLYDPLADRVLDYVGGQADLKDGVIRAIGDPRQRFKEDKLRMLRAVRFAARFNFPLESATHAAIAEMADQINAVSAERIAQEMRAILTHPSRARGTLLCWTTGLLRAILPEILPLAEPPPGGLHGGTLWAHTLFILEHLREPSFPLALAGLLHRIGQPWAEGPEQRAEIGARIAYEVCRRWRLSNEETDRVVWLVRHFNDLQDAVNMPWPRLQRLLVMEGIEELLALREADCAGSRLPQDSIQYCRQRLRQPREQIDPPPLITGHDLIAHGVPKGKVYQALLDQVRDAQLEGRITNKRAALRFVDELRAKCEVTESPYVWRN